MPKIKTFLLLTLVLVFSFSLFGCGFFSADTAAPEELTGQDGELPEWLLAAHRNVENPDTEATDDLPASDDDDLVIEGDGATTPSAVQETPTQPTGTSTPAPATSQPAASSTSNEVPKWKQPGTSEYLQKMTLDDLVARYKRLKARNEPTEADKAEIARLEEGIKGLSGELGVNLSSEYGLTISDSSGVDNGSFGDWDDTPDWLN